MKPSPLWLSVASVLAVIFLSSLIGATFAVLARSSNVGAAAPVQNFRPISVSPDDLALGIKLREESSGWNMVQFMDYGCLPCRTDEAKLTQEIPVFAPNVGRIIMPWPNPDRPESHWPSLCAAAYASQDPEGFKALHRLFMTGQPPNKEAALRRISESLLDRSKLSTAQVEEEVVKMGAEDRLARISALATRMDLKGVPGYLLVSPTGEGWIASSLDDWKALTAKHGPR